MTQGLNYESSSDGLYRGVPLTHSADLPVLGVPVRFESNSRAVLDAVEESFGVWRRLEPHPELLSSERVRVRLIVHPGAESAAGHAPLVYRMPDPDRRLIMTPGSVAVAELRQREGYAYVTPALVGDRSHFRYGVIEALTFMLVSDLDRHPLHAAVIVRGDSAVLLHGSSGTGKSTLAYAAAQAGLKVLAEDVVYLQLEPELRVWGLPGRLHLPEDSAARFPELGDAVLSLMANGKRKIPVDVFLNGDAPIPATGAVGVCLLRRGSRALCLERQSPGEVEAALARGVEMGFDVYADAIRPRLSRLARSGGWRLELAGHPSDAIPLIHQMLDQLDRRPE